jgi:hypothetical protein
MEAPEIVINRLYRKIFDSLAKKKNQTVKELLDQMKETEDVGKDEEEFFFLFNSALMVMRESKEVVMLFPQDKTGRERIEGAMVCLVSK